MLVLYVSCVCLTLVYERCQCHVQSDLTSRSFSPHPLIVLFFSCFLLCFLFQLVIDSSEGY